MILKLCDKMRYLENWGRQRKEGLQRLDLKALQCLEKSAETIKGHSAGKPVRWAEKQERKVSWRPHVMC